MSIGHVGIQLQSTSPQKGGGSGFIEKDWTDKLIKLLLEHARLDRGYNIPLAGGISENLSPIYSDKAIAQTYAQKDGKQVPAMHYLMIHEFVEKAIMDALVKIGADPDEVYLPSHAIATAGELAALEEDGYDIKQYDKFWDREIPVAAKHKLGDGTPPDLETKPYEES